jgi:hypothetical protein
MRGTIICQATMLSTLTSDSLIPLDHPIRRIKPVVEVALAELAPEFDAMYARTGRQERPPGAFAQGDGADGPVLDAQRAPVCERLRYDLLFKFFLDLNRGSHLLSQPSLSPLARIRCVRLPLRAKLQNLALP